VETIHAHPAGGVGLFDIAPGGERFAPVKDADIVETEKAALEYVSAAGVLAIDPPGEVQEQFLKNPFEKLAVAFTAPFHFYFVDTPGCPGVDRRIDVAERPFV